MSAVTVHTPGGVLARWRGRAGSPARPRTAAGEWVRAEAVDDAGRAVVATTDALYHQAATGAAGDWRRWGWERLLRVDLATDRQSMTWYEPAWYEPAEPGSAAQGSAATAGLAVLPRAGGRRLAAFAAERIAATLVLATRVILDDGREARVHGRRAPGTGELLWLVRLPPGGAVTDPRTDASVTAAIAGLRRRHGL